MCIRLLFISNRMLTENGSLSGQIPLYPVTIFRNETDGKGMSIVLYFKLSECHSKELPLHFQDGIMVRWFPTQ